MVLSAPWRRLVLVLHVTTSVGLAGAVAGFLTLAIAGLVSAESVIAQSVYPSMQLLTWDVILPTAIISLVVGVIQSLGTPWGLFRHYWIIIKLVLTSLALAVLFMQLDTIDLLSEAAQTGTIEHYGRGRLSTVLHGAGGLAVLLTATVLSVYKPRGTTRFGARAIEEGR